MRRRSLLLAFGALLLSLAPLAPAQSGDDHKPKASPTVSAPVVQVIDLNGLRTVLKRDNSRPLVVNFWATWCDPCRDEFPDLVKIDTDYRSKGLDFISISLDDLKDIKTEVPKFLSEMKATMPAYLLDVSDPEPAIKLVDPEWAGAMPATFLYNQKGEIVFKHFGRVKPEELRAAIDKLIAASKQ